MSKNVLTCSEGMKHEYCASVIRVGELHPLEGADKLEKTLVNGNSFVVEKGSIKEGEICFYCENETELNENFLSVNNQYDMENRDRNANADEVNALLEPANKLKEEIKEDEKPINKMKKLLKKVQERDKLVEKIERTKQWMEENKTEYERLKVLNDSEEVVHVSPEEKKLFEDYERNITTLAKKENTLLNYENIKDKTADEVQKMIDDATAILKEKKDKREELIYPIKSMVGYFNKYGRVRAIRLRGCPSYGYLFGVDAMKKWCPEIENVNLEELVGTDFDTVNGELFCKAYVPRIKERTPRGHSDKKNKKLKKFDMLIPGEFAFHYDTEKLQKNIQNFNPNDTIFISVKVHGTSGIFSNVKVRYPKEFHTPWTKLNTWLQKMYLTVVPEKFQSVRIDYGNIYSSRTVIKNATFNPGVGEGYYKDDIWAEVNSVFKDFLDKGMSLYGEIVGYLPSGGSIQKGYDYGCEQNTWKLMPYRIVTEQEDGRKYEWSVSDVANWTKMIMREHPEVADKMMVIDILYHGTLAELYPEIDTQNHWHENVLEALKVEKKFGMEMNEPLCNNEVPREGVVLRFDCDGYEPKALEAYKLKTDAFFEREKAEIDAGYVDVEMADAYNAEATADDGEVEMTSEN